VFYNGKNVADFYSKDVGARLQALMAEEKEIERQEAEVHSSDSELDDDEMLLLEEITGRQMQAHSLTSRKKMLMNNRPMLPRTANIDTGTRARRKLSTMETHLNDLGVDTSKLRQRAQQKLQEAREKYEAAERRGRSREPRSIAGMDGDGDVDMDASSSSKPRLRSKSKVGIKERVREPSPGLPSIEATIRAVKKMRKAQKKWQKQGRKGPADRKITTKLPKHLFFRAKHDVRKTKTIGR